MTNAAMSVRIGKDITSEGTANQQRARQGKHFGTCRPFGCETRYKTIRESEVAAIREAFELILNWDPPLRWLCGRPRGCHPSILLPSCQHPRVYRLHPSRHPCSNASEHP